MSVWLATSSTVFGEDHVFPTGPSQTSILVSADRKRAVLIYDVDPDDTSELSRELIPDLEDEDAAWQDVENQRHRQAVAEWEHETKYTTGRTPARPVRRIAPPVADRGLSSLAKEISRPAWGERPPEAQHLNRMIARHRVR